MHKVYPYKYGTCATSAVLRFVCVVGINIIRLSLRVERCTRRVNVYPVGAVYTTGSTLRIQVSAIYNNP